QPVARDRRVPGWRQPRAAQLQRGLVLTVNTAYEPVLHSLFNLTLWLDGAGIRRRAVAARPRHLRVRAGRGAGVLPLDHDPARLWRSHRLDDGRGRRTDQRVLPRACRARRLDGLHRCADPLRGRHRCNRDDGGDRVPDPLQRADLRLAAGASHPGPLACAERGARRARGASQRAHHRGRHERTRPQDRRSPRGARRGRAGGGHVARQPGRADLPRDARQRGARRLPRGSGDARCETAGLDAPDRGDEPAARVLGQALRRTDEHPRVRQLARGRPAECGCDARDPLEGSRDAPHCRRVPQCRHLCMTGFAILLAAAAVAFGVSRRFDMAPIPFLVVAGMVLARIDAFPVEMLQDALIYGLTVVLFVSGTELSPSRVRGQRAVAVQVGIIQFGVIALAGTGIALLLGYARLTAAYVGLALAASSTLVIVRLLQRRRQLYE